VGGLGGGAAASIDSAVAMAQAAARSVRGVKDRQAAARSGTGGTSGGGRGSAKSPRAAGGSGGSDGAGWEREERAWRNARAVALQTLTTERPLVAGLFKRFQAAAPQPLSGGSSGDCSGGGGGSGGGSGGGGDGKLGLSQLAGLLQAPSLGLGLGPQAAARLATEALAAASGDWRGAGVLPAESHAEGEGSDSFGFSFRGGAGAGGDDDGGGAGSGASGNGRRVGLSELVGALGLLARATVAAFEAGGASAVRDEVATGDAGHHGEPRRGRQGQGTPAAAAAAAAGGAAGASVERGLSGRGDHPGSWGEDERAAVAAAVRRKLVGTVCVCEREREREKHQQSCASGRAMSYATPNPTASFPLLSIEASVMSFLFSLFLLLTPEYTARACAFSTCFRPWTLETGRAPGPSRTCGRWA